MKTRGHKIGEKTTGEGGHEGEEEEDMKDQEGVVDRIGEGGQEKKEDKRT